MNVRGHLVSRLGAFISPCGLVAMALLIFGVGGSFGWCYSLHDRTNAGRFPFALDLAYAAVRQPRDLFQDSPIDSFSPHVVSD